MPTITVEFDTFHRIVATGAVAGNDSLTPILAGVQVSVAGGELRALATDRYAAVRMIHPHNEIDELPAVVIPAKALADAARQGKNSALVSITHDVETGYVSIDWGTGSLSTQAIGGNYPPIDRLFPNGNTGDVAAGTLIDPRRLVQLSKLTRPARRPADRFVAFEFSQILGDEHTAGKRKPVVAVGDRYEVIIQPNIPT